MRKSSLLALTVIGGLACVSQAAIAQWAPMPAPRFERAPPPPPGPRMAWQRGGWDWDGRGYVWRPGRYVAWERHHHRWLPGHWTRHREWVPAHWG